MSHQTIQWHDIHQDNPSHTGTLAEAKEWLIDFWVDNPDDDTEETEPESTFFDRIRKADIYQLDNMMEGIGWYIDLPEEEEEPSNIELKIHRVKNDVNGNPMYHIYVGGIHPRNLPTLASTQRVNRRVGYYTVQSYLTQAQVLEEFKANNLTTLQKLEEQI